MTTLVHISDVHFGDADPHKLVAASRAIACINPDCVILTGDLTQEGKKKEFDLAVDWFKTIKVPIVACPGNHDTPMFNLVLRAFNPFGRFKKLGLLSSWQSGDGIVQIEAANSARGLQWRLDWSQGDYDQPEVLAALKRLRASQAHHRILALHHPPETPAGASVTSEPSGITGAALHFKQYEPDLVLSGHVHAAFDFQARNLNGIRVMTVPSLASSRQRGFGSGFGVIKVTMDRQVISRTIWRYQSGLFQEIDDLSKGILDIAG